MARPTWFLKLLQVVYRQRKYMAIMTKFPFIGQFIKRTGFEGDSIICLPKDHVININQSVDLQGSLVLPSKVAEALVEQANYRWIMNFCICRTSNKCKDYPQDVGCLFLGEAVTQINPKWGRLVSKPEALAYLKRCRELGLVHMVGKNKLDSLWLGIDEKKLLTICNCCPCCCISGGLKTMSPQIAQYYTKMPGVEVKVTDRCVGCGTCAKKCYLEAIHIINDRARIDTNMCRGCGRCVEACPRKAIELTLTDDQFLQKSVERLVKLVDLT